MAGVELESGGKRAVNREINMIPFIDMLLVTIAFLLITAVWVSYSRMEATANLPGAERGPDLPETGKVLHVHATDDAFVVTWRQGATTFSETRLGREKVAGRYEELAALLAREWKQHGSHRDPSDLGRDLCVFHADNAMSFGEMVAVMDAIHEAKREVVADGRRRRVPVFHTSLAAR